MKKKTVKQVPPLNDEAPKTIGELRKLLAAHGNPWLPDPGLSDEELIPVFPTGGDNSKKSPGKMLQKDAVIDFLRKTPPTNPFLLEVWKKRGLLETNEKTKGAVKKQRSSNGG